MLSYGVLGPLRVTRAGLPVPIGAKKQRTVLALLLARANRAVGLDDLVDEVWSHDPPVSAVANVRTYAANLRRVFASCGAPDALTRSGDGYQLTVETAACDALAFDDLRRRADDERGGGDLHGCVRTLEQAAALWRGPALLGVAAGAHLRPYRAALDESRLAALEELAAARIEVGAWSAAVPGLRELVAAHPLREGAQVLLMRALHGQGDVAAALRVFGAARAALVDELGVEPGPALRAAQREILAAGAVDGAGPPPGPATPPRPTATPNQLPADLHTFTGRSTQLDRLDEVLAAARSGRGGAVVITAIAGTAGIGKTSLAVHWAHRVRDSFPDGQLYVNLRGFDPSGAPVDPGDALRGFLEALGTPSDRIPADPQARAGLYRSLLARTRTLVLLDNARDAEQVRPLLPGAGTCLALVTSRNDLAGLVAAESAHPIALDVLPPDEATALLAHRLGPDRLAAEPAATAEIVARCARLPLALAVVAARAALRPDLSLGELAAELAGGADRLDPFHRSDPATDLRTVFDCSFRSLTPAGAALFALLGRTPGPDISLAAVASLAGVELDAARTTLAELVEANLVDAQRPGRYAMHDLLRAYAGGLPADAEPAVTRLLDHYLHTADAAVMLIRPSHDAVPLPRPLPGTTVATLTDDGDAGQWFAVERPLLLDAVETAARNRPAARAWELALALFVYLYRQGHWHEAEAALRTGLAAARAAGEPTAQVRVHRSLAGTLARLGRLADAHRELADALRLAEEVDDKLERAHTHGTIAQLHAGAGEHDPALANLDAAEELFRAAGHRVGQAKTKNAIGWMYGQLGDLRRALANCEEALALHQAGDDRRDEADAWDSVAYVHHRLGQHDKAVRCYEQALELFRQAAEPYEEATTLTRLGEAHRTAGDAAAARRAWRRAATILDDLGHADAEAVRERLAGLSR